MSSIARYSKKIKREIKRNKDEELLAMRSKHAEGTFKSCVCSLNLIIIFQHATYLPPPPLVCSVFSRVFRTSVFMDSKLILLSPEHF
jgi:hypothetical protein